jgi:hypothetical protein
MSDKMTRRTAIVASLLALGGVPIYAQKKDDSSSDGLLATTNMTPIGISVSLDQITFVDIHRGKETVHITGDEIWKALHD